MFTFLAVEQNIESWIQSVGNFCSSHSYIFQQGRVMHMNDVPHSSLSARNSSKMQIRSGSTVTLSSHSCILVDPAPAVCLTHYAIQWDLHEIIKWLSFRNLIMTLFATDTLKYQAETRSPPTFTFISTRSFMLDSNPRFSVCTVSFYPCRPTWPTHHSSHHA